MLQVICVSNIYLPAFESSVNQRLGEINADPAKEFSNIVFTTVLQPQSIIHTAYITYIVVTIYPRNAESAIVTPPSPAEVRNEKERLEENTDRSLDQQLADPNLGDE